MNAPTFRGPSWAWPRWPATLRSPIWHCILAALCSLGLLLSFHQVVRGAVEQGELRRAATAAHAKATWRCNALTSLSLRDGCLARLAAGPRDEVGPQAQYLER